MGQDSDVARVAAAMNAPGFKYRSFGNEPVRIRPGAAGTLAQPPAEMQTFPELSEPPAPLLEVEPLPAYVEEPVFEALPPPTFAYETYREPEPEPEPPVMVAEPPPPPMPEPPPAPLFSWPETPAYAAPEPARVAPPSLLPDMAQAYAPRVPQPAPPLAPGGFRLLESIGHRPGDGAAPRLNEQPAGGTLGLLRRAAEVGDASGTTQLGMGAGSGFGMSHGGPLPPLSPSGHQSGLLPAAAVTVPLSDVMRLIAAGATPPPSPFDAFRAALGAQPGR